MTDLPLIRPQWPAPPRVVAVSTTRQGGVSHGRFESLNLGAGVPDAPSDVIENRRRLVAAAGLPAEPHWLKQVHGKRVVDASDPTDSPPEADAAIARRTGIVCAVLTADCLPVIFCDRFGSRIGVAHAGWRGLAAGVIEATLAAMPQTSADMLAWFGPAIGPCCYEVGAEVREAFVTAQGDDAERYFILGQARGKFHADLYGLAALRLHRAGIKSITGGDQCTACDAHNYFSHRRDGQTGRMATLVTLLPS